ncbi:polysaccharide export protein [Aliiglaciecola sp. CAU 1673]|uniref:polysaccharide biosynthesis/export family protein n=1 Tax=Aliiglaciecola sp. CAU 1673 TaxID=3032595 RepID=UPI0023DB273D|nr:polysaccharide biosynthesis/export family protein [Aliiglaciecola sp. CAU 1673]MDF2179796.1 polysaccharide export protein [Aliiglaciecola sp. CAU 1673]
MAVSFLKRALIALLLPMVCYVHANEDQYRIDAGDSIAIVVFNEPELSIKAKIAQSGQIRFPLLGDINVLDKTPDELAHEIEAALVDGYLVNPDVSVTIEAYRPIFVKGAVKKAGSHPFVFELNVEQAIAMAGGLTDRASKSDWHIIRKGEKIKANKSTTLMPGDVITIGESLF